MDVSGDRPQELRRSLELSANAQRRQGDCPSDDYDSIEEDITSEPEPEPEGCPGGDCPLSTGDKDAPEDREAGGRPPQGPDTLVVLEFNPASQNAPLALMTAGKVLHETRTEPIWISWDSLSISTPPCGHL
ncbi:katanin-interacting protein-like isoform X5 [Lepus europaeus]|uniref:katanin-interacting protein-like isoform X5 n=1 Tax=Lepus europaeus TaxID=9983 RepID=UPI002B46FCEA|nr:katanin-interacting protein-like isoform X5 [Lepus europaeus]